MDYKYMVVTHCFTFNHAPYIADAMNGFTMQETTFPVITLIVDDASTDGEPEVIKQYLTDHFQTPYRIEETEDYNLICANHNTNPNCTFVVFLLKYNHYSIKKDKFPYLAEWLDNAKYIAICEGDDYWIHPGKLQIQVEAMERDHSISLCHTAFDYAKEDGSLLRSGDLDSEMNQRILEKGEDVRFHILNGNRYRIQTMSTLFPASMEKEYLSNRPSEWRSFLMGDTPRWIQLLEKGKVCFINQKTSMYRIHNNSACRPADLKKRLRFVLSSDEMRIILGEYIHLDDRKMAVLHKSYMESLRHYMYLEPSYQPIVPPRFDNVVQKTLFRLKTSFLLRPVMRFLLLQKRNILQWRAKRQ